MLIDKKTLQLEVTLAKEKTDQLIQICHNAPAEVCTNANHLGNIVTLFPYLYHTALVKKYLPSPAKILDWGAYLGQVTYLLKDEYNAVAHNPRKENDITYWFKKLGITSSTYSITLDGLEDTEHFDAAISSGVLEHTFEYGATDLEALRDLQKKLNNDGLLFIWNLPTTHALSELFTLWRKRWKHPVRYELDDILVKLATAGFEVIAVERNEIFFSQLCRLLPFISMETLWEFDHWLANLPVIKRFAHHFTIVARKVSGFPQNPSRSLYTTYA